MLPIRATDLYGVGQRNGDEGAIAIAQEASSFDSQSQKACDGDKSQMQEQGIAYFNGQGYGSSDSTILFTVVIA